GAGATAVAAVALGQGQQVFGGLRAAVEDHVLDRIPQLRGQFVIDRELAGVDDAHAQPGGDGVVEKDGVDRLAHPVVAAKRERDVADPARGQTAGQVVADPAHRLDEFDRVAVVFLDAGGDGEHIGIEYD